MKHKVTYSPLDLFPDETNNKESIKLVEKIKEQIDNNVSTMNVI